MLPLGIPCDGNNCCRDAVSRLEGIFLMHKANTQHFKAETKEHLRERGREKGLAVHQTAASTIKQVLQGLQYSNVLIAPEPGCRGLTNSTNQGFCVLHSRRTLKLRRNFHSSILQMRGRACLLRAA